MEERRKSPRTSANETAFISVAGASTRCRIDNISPEGAAIDVLDAAYVPQRFQLMTKKDRVIRNCRIVWIMKNKIGVEFDN